MATTHTVWTAISNTQPIIQAITQEEVKVEIAIVIRKFRKINKNAASLENLIRKIDHILAKENPDEAAVQEIYDKYNELYKKAAMSRELTKNLSILKGRIITVKRSTSDDVTGKIFSTLLKETERTIEHASRASGREYTLLKKAYNQILYHENSVSWRITALVKSYWTKEPELFS
jgi:translation initiation factor 2B subunit (eIF-2B alpha/beta/delta family)